jgi:hypothetical protein
MPVNYDQLAARFDERYQYQLFVGFRPACAVWPAVPLSGCSGSDVARDAGYQSLATSLSNSCELIRHLPCCKPLVLGSPKLSWFARLQNFCRFRRTG